MSADDAISLGWTGPCLRASGVPYDVRKAHPYLKYGEVEFDVPVGSAGDTLDRYVVRLEEIKQSAKIIRQCIDRMPDDGAVHIDDPRVVLPPKDEVYTTIEATIQHFKIVMEGIKLPAGEVYSYTEAGNGELGFYLVSDGSGTPYRVRMRPPCFFTTAGVERLITGQMLADVVPCFGSVNMVDRGVDIPDDEESLRNGYAAYDGMCVPCHGGPGVQPDWMGKGMHPTPPDLQQVARQRKPEEVYWVLKNGIKDAGMPALGPSHDDRDIRELTAFVMKLANMSATDYDRFHNGRRERRQGRASDPRGQ